MLYLPFLAISPDEKARGHGEKGETVPMSVRKQRKWDEDEVGPVLNFCTPFVFCPHALIVLSLRKVPEANMLSLQRVFMCTTIFMSPFRKYVFNKRIESHNIANTGN